MAENLAIYEMPVVKLPTLLVAFAGWSDAQEGSTYALRYLAEKLPAKRFAEIDPEEFYDFTRVRPMAFYNAEGQRVVKWPPNEFFYWAGAGSPRHLVLFSGIEPQLKWRAFVGMIAGLVQQLGVTMVVSLGSLMSEAPHTRETRLTGSANNPELRKLLEGLGCQASGRYQGPTGINTALMEACTRQGLSYASIWGHAPHYLQVSPNPRVSYKLLHTVSLFLGIPFKLDTLRQEAHSFQTEVEKLIAGNPEVSTYVKRLEEQYDSAAAQQPSQEAMPSPEVLLKDLEDFLKQQRDKGKDSDNPQPDKGGS